MELPKLQDELDRKSFEALDWLASSFTRGRLNGAQYAAGLETLFMTVAGITNDDVVNLISSASGIAGSSVAVEKRHFVKAITVVSLAWGSGQEGFSLDIRESGIAKASKYCNCDTAQAARDGVAVYAQKLLDMGYTEL